MDRRANDGIVKPEEVQRCVRLASNDIEYVLKRSAKRKTIGLKIDHHGLTVHAPWRASEKWLKEVLEQNQNWIARKLLEVAQQKSPSLLWEDGAELLYLGHSIRLKFNTGSQPNLAPPFLFINSADAVSPSVLRSAVARWYKSQAMANFSERTRHYALRLDLASPPLRLSNAQHLWGSCNNKGLISLNWRLIQAPQQEIDYVIAHELAHLLELNHSPRFWRIVESIFPDYSEARLQLRAAQDKYYRMG